MKGLVVRIIAGFYDIYAQQKYFRVRGAGKLRQDQNSPLVGDYVEFVPKETITKIYERKNVLIRPKVANVDQVAIIMSLKEPDYNSFLLTKLLAIIEYKQISPLLIFTKTDLSEKGPLASFLKMGYQAHQISNKTQSNLDQIKDLFDNKLTVFTGQSGAGKSSTISSLTKIFRQTQEISLALGRGKHTTRVVEIIPWHKGWLIDTPGFSTFEVALTKKELSVSYRIFEKYRHKCQFKNCLHLHEKKCGIKEAVSKNIIDQQFYQNYLRLLKEAEDD